jgi:peroxiredoxin
MAEVSSAFFLRPGDPAPGFALFDPAGGRMVSLDAVAGTAGTVVVFACNHCPYVIHLADELGRLAREVTGLGVTTVAINPNDSGRYPEDAPDKMPAFAAAHRWEFPYLRDETQEVAQAYGAACTPDFFLFDAQRRLFYAGQFDCTRPQAGEPPTGSDLRAAVRVMLAGGPPPAHPLPSSGCSIKWRQ